MRCFKNDFVLLLQIQNSITMEKLFNILKQFDQVRTSKLDNWNEDAVIAAALPLAKEILCNGYFLVNGKYIIEIGAIELYYHEEIGKIKDHVMYHINEHLPKNYKEMFKFDGGYPYFTLGSFNLHQSGVDITFENEKQKYRASFLIRSYRVLTTIEDIANQDIKYDPYSTHIYDDLFYSGLLLSTNERTTIEWIVYDRGGEVEQMPRKNIEDTRLWQFRRKGIIEKK